MDVFLVRGNVVVTTHAGIDTRSDFVACEVTVARQLGYVPPLARQAGYSGAGGTQAGALSFPPDGQVGLFVTDYTEYCYLPSSPIGFHPPSPHAHQQRSVLGLTGFLQFFRLVLDYGPAHPVFELHPVAGFPGQAGPLPKTGLLHDFIRGLHAAP
jgi:hypothetical protein